MICAYVLQFSSEHRVKSSKQQKKVGFETRPDINKIECDYIGPPDKLSNLRPVIRHVPADETPLERELRLKRTEVEEWNQKFWTNHNQRFFKVSAEVIWISIINCCHWTMSILFIYLCFTGETIFHKSQQTWTRRHTVRR